MTATLSIPQAADITGLILCGGAATRMGGADKGLVQFHGKPLVDIAIDRLKPQVAQLMISANRNIRDYETRGYPVLKDPNLQDNGPNYEGPLAGILAGLQAMQTAWLAVIPCDSPQFPDNLVDRLAQASNDPTRPRTVDGQPTFSLLPASLIKPLQLFLQHGQRKLGQWLEAQQAVAVRFDQPDGFRNLNTPQDLD